MYTTTTNLDKECLKVAYLGDYPPSIRDLRPLYDACANLDFTCLTIAGHGPKFDDQPNIKVLPRIPQNQALEIENNADVIFSACNLRGTQIPGKIFYKASSDKHILVAVEQEYRDEMVRYFESYKRYVVCENTAESIEEALKSLRNRPHEYTTPERLLPENVVKEILA